MLNFSDVLSTELDSPERTAPADPPENRLMKQAVEITFGKEALLLISSKEKFSTKIPLLDTGLNRLEPGDKAGFHLDVSQNKGDSGIFVRPGELYEITASGTWRDGDLPPCDARGFFVSQFEAFRRPIFKAAAPLRAVDTGDRWCGLVVEVNGEYHAFRDDLRIIVHPEKAGTLKFFVNDALFGNNKGALDISIRRVGSPLKP